MRLDLDNLPHDTALLHRLVRDMAAQVSTRDGEIERLRHIVKELQRMRFGRRSERLDPDQLALGLEDLDADIAGVEASRPAPEPSPVEPGPRRKPLPDHLAREDGVQEAAGRRGSPVAALVSHAGTPKNLLACCRMHSTCGAQQALLSGTTAAAPSDCTPRPA
jgi:hypothetical protein